MAECLDRCARIHPHCTLSLARDVAPATHWHWIVTMPDGHIFAVSRGPLSLDEAVADMTSKGVHWLKAADSTWREHHLHSEPPTDNGMTDSGEVLS